MAKELIIYNMTFEVTRRCNKQCKHCLRGHSEYTDMTQQVAEEALKDVTSIGSLAFTGGEPTLNVDIITCIKNFIIRNEIQLGNFFIATNGTIYSEELVDTLYELYDYVTEQYGDSELCTLSISSNQFQEPNPEVVKQYSNLPFFKDYNDCIIPSDQILNTGLAYDNNIGGKDLEVCELDIEIIDDKINVNNGNVYINALGGVTSDCDLSYEQQDKHKLGNILANDLVDIIENAAQ